MPPVMKRKSFQEVWNSASLKQKKELYQALTNLFRYAGQKGLIDKPILIPPKNLLTARSGAEAYILTKVMQSNLDFSAKRQDGLFGARTAKGINAELRERS